jgi:protein-L-isoaspartate(D-aspartate) O-methyltransferase
MPIASEHRWRALARALSKGIETEDARLRHGFAETPRHVFVPVFYERDAGGFEAITEVDARWLPGIYTDDALTTQVRDTPLGMRATSSTSQPSVMAAMLDLLALEDGMRVLEVGTGTGYNAGILSHLLRAEQVTSIDIDPDLVAQARDRLASLGLHPHLATGDGAKGWPEGAPYDRVIATHAVEQVPYTWVAQTRPGGVIVADIRSVGAPQIGHLARLIVQADGTAHGDFRVPLPGAFMPDRNDLDQPHYVGLSAYDLREASTRPTTLGARALKNQGFAFWLWTRLPDLTLRIGLETSLSTPDGSWALAPTDPGEVQVAGPRDLWHVVESQHTDWHAAGCPGLDAYTVTVAPEGQCITTRM